MKISRIKISNVLGVEDLEFEAGRFNEITGTNGSGKTSFIEALKAVIKGGVDATLLRRGAEKGEIVLIIDDGTEIRKRLTSAGSQVTTVRKSGKLVAPAETIKDMTDMLSVNPVEFLRAPKKQRLSVMLDSLPIQADMAKLSKIVGREIKVGSGQHALELIEAVYKQVFDDRTGTNRAVREKHSTINQLSATLPDSHVVVSGDDLNGLLATLATIDGEKDAEIIRIGTKLDGLRTESETKRQSIRDAGNERRADIQEKIDTLKTQLADQIAALMAEDAAIIQVAAAGVAAEAEAFSKIERLAGTQRENTLANHTLKRSDVAAAVARVQQEQNQAGRTAQTRETVAAMREDAETLEADAARQSAALLELESYKSELLAVLPIDGLAVVEGEIFRHGVPFDRLNTAQQVTIAVEIAKLRAGALGFICVDGLEALDNAHFEAFRELSLQTDLQFFVSRVTDGEFAVTAEF